MYKRIHQRNPEQKTRNEIIINPALKKTPAKSRKRTQKEIYVYYLFYFLDSKSVLSKARKKYMDPITSRNSLSSDHG